MKKEIMMLINKIITEQIIYEEITHFLSSWPVIAKRDYRFANAVCFVSRSQQA